jgi:hypothetical protein
MRLLPLFLEVLELFPIDLPSILALIVLLDLGNRFELLNDLLVVAAALSSRPIVKVLLESLEYL